MTELSSNAKAIAENRYFEEGEDWEAMSRRVGSAIAHNEKDREKWTETFSNEIYDMSFIPAGRILRNAGKLRQSLLNCACLPISDSIEEIGETLKNALIFWSYGAGIGIDFSPLREKGRPLHSKGGVSSGMLSFLKAFDNIAHTIETGGNRRSGCLGLCRISHPEIFDFIDSKKNDGDLSYFNLSVGITNSFLRAVEEDSNWDLTFAGQTVKTIKANDLWDKLLESNIKNGDPGIINLDNLYKNNTFYFQPIEATNLCSEIPLPGFGTCALTCLVLPSFISNTSMNWKKLEVSIYNAIRFLDNVIDINFYPIKQSETVTKDSRRIGLGVMGLHDYLLTKNIRYGSERSLYEIERLFKFIRNTAYLASVQLAIEKGAFPKFSKSEYSKASFIRKLPARIRMEIKDKGIRHSCMLAGQPSGTTSLLADVSSGIEPVFSLAYKRSDRVSERYYVHPKLIEFIESGEKDKPDYLVDVADLKPEDHLEVQSCISRFVDNSISKTVNCPKGTSKDDLSKLLLEHVYDLKGVTIYVDGSKKGQVLNKIDIKEVRKKIKEGKVSSFDNEKVQDCKSGVCDI